jgi:glycine reductase
MRLEMGTFPVREIAFGARTRYAEGRVEVDRDEIIRAVSKDVRIRKVELEIAHPGESVRIWPMRDVIEPRIKVEGPGVCYPGICGRSILTVGQGRTHRLAGMGIVEVANVDWHAGGGDYVEDYLDMSGPFAELYPMSKLANLCVVLEPEPALNNEAQNHAVHNAALVVNDLVAAAVKDLTAPEIEVFELAAVAPSLPKVIYIQCVHSPQAMSGSRTAFCTSTYGMTQLTGPWWLHPNEILDGALTGPYRTAFATSWTVGNNPSLLELCRRHGRDWDFLGVIAFRTEWTTQHEKELMANQAAKLAERLGAQGTLVTWDAGGNEFIEVIRTVQACERHGIKTVFMTTEDTAADGAPTLLMPLPEADAIVSTGFFRTPYMNWPKNPPVKRVIGLEQKVTGPLRDRFVPTAGELDAPFRVEDVYGFRSLSCIE